MCAPVSYTHLPNVGAVLAVGLGCEYVQPEWLSKIAEEEGKPKMCIRDSHQAGGFRYRKVAGGLRTSVLEGERRCSGHHR